MISNTVRKAGPFDGNDSADTFAFDFKVFKTSDVLVVRTAASSGVEDTLTLGTDYSVTLNGNQDTSPGGSVRILSGPLASTFTLTLASQVPYSQPTVFTNTGGFYPAVLNDSLDRLTIQVQQLQEVAGRTLQLAISSTSGVSVTLPAPVGGSFLGWDGPGATLINYSGLASVGVSTFMAPIVAMTNQGAVRAAIGAQAAGSYAASGANNDITALSALASVPSITAAAILLATAQATESSRGTAKLATQTLADAGANDTDLMTPAKTLAAKIKQGSAVTLTGNSVTLANAIPAWAKWVAVQIVGASTSGNLPIEVRLNGESTGYLGSSAAQAGTTGLATTNHSTGFKLDVIPSYGSAEVLHGHATIMRFGDTNTWTASGSFGQSDFNRSSYMGGSKSLSAALTSLQLVSADGFDAGQACVMWG